MGFKQNCYQITSTLLQQAVSCARCAKSSGIAKKARFEKEYIVVPYQKEKDLIPLVEHGFMGFGAKRDTGEWTDVWMDLGNP